MDFPLPAYNYTVSFGGETLAFASVSGLDLGREVTPYYHGLSFQEGPTLVMGATSTVRLTLTRGIFRSGNLGRFYQWFSTLDAERPTTQDVTVQLCDFQGQAVVMWLAMGCVPVRLSAPTLSADSNSTAIETVELVAAKLTLSFPDAS